jgi:hypothetical protein
MFDLLTKKWEKNTAFISDPFTIQKEGRLDPFSDPKNGKHISGEKKLKPLFIRPLTFINIMVANI